MVLHHAFDAHQRPPEAIRLVFRRYQKLKIQQDVDLDPDIVDPLKLLDAGDHATGWQRRAIDRDLQTAFASFADSEGRPQSAHEETGYCSFESQVLPGQAMLI